VIRVLVVDDSMTVRHWLIEMMARTPDIQVVGEASDGRRAVELTKRLRPDVVTLDLALPDMNGLAATEQIMAHVPTPILIVSASFNRGELFATYHALAAGAVDVLDKSHDDTDADWENRFVAAVQGELWLWTREDRFKWSRRLFAFMTNGLYMKQPLDRVRFDPFHHAGEEIKPLTFVFNQGVFLSVAAKTDAVAQMVHPQQVILPMMIDDLKHEGLFEKTHQVWA